MKFHLDLPKPNLLFLTEITMCVATGNTPFVVLSYYINSQLYTIPGCFVY